MVSITCMYVYVKFMPFIKMCAKSKNSKHDNFIETIESSLSKFPLFKQERLSLGPLKSCIYNRELDLNEVLL